MRRLSALHDRRASDGGERLTESGRHAATAATIAFIAGGRRLVAAGVVLLLVALEARAVAASRALAAGITW